MIFGKSNFIEIMIGLLYHEFTRLRGIMNVNSEIDHKCRGRGISMAISPQCSWIVLNVELNSPHSEI